MGSALVYQHIWIFPARLERVVDGDTLDMIIDCGFKTYRHDRVRLIGVDTPEMRGKSVMLGLEARRWVSQWLRLHEEALDWPLAIQTLKDPDSFGRCLARVYRVVDKACLNDDLISAGIAIPYKQ